MENSTKSDALSILDNAKNIWLSLHEIASGKIGK